MFRPMAMTVLFALATAFVLSLTLVPAVASALLPLDARDRPSPLVELVQARLHAGASFRPALAEARRGSRRCSRSPAASAGATEMGREFLPKLDEGTMVVGDGAPPVGVARAVDGAGASGREDAPGVPRGHERRVPHGPRRDRRRPDGHEHDATSTSCSSPRTSGRRPTRREGLVETFDKALGESVPGAGFAFSAADRDEHERSPRRHLVRSRAPPLRQRSRRAPSDRRPHGAHAARRSPARGRARRADRRHERAHRHRRSPGRSRAPASTRRPSPTPSARSAGSRSARSSTARSAIRCACASRDGARHDARSIAAVPVRDELGNLVPLGQLAHGRDGARPVADQPRAPAAAHHRRSSTCAVATSARSSRRRRARSIAT